MKKLLALLLALAMIFALAACGGTGGGDSKTEAPSGDLVGVAMPTKDLQRWNQDGENMKAMLEKAGYQVDLQYGANDIATQVSQIENMIANGCKALVIASIDGDSLGTVLAQAKEKGIPVIAYDRLIMNSDAVTYYATFDNWLVGTKQGEFIEAQLGLKDGKGPFNIEFITGDPGDNNINFFFDGAMSAPPARPRRQWSPPPTGPLTLLRPALRTSSAPTMPIRIWMPSSPPTTLPLSAWRTRCSPLTAATCTRSSPVRTATLPS